MQRFFYYKIVLSYSRLWLMIVYYWGPMCHWAQRDWVLEWVIIAVIFRFHKTSSSITCGNYKLVQLRSCIFWSVIIMPFQPHALLPWLTIQILLLSSCSWIELWLLLYSFLAVDGLDPSFSFSFNAHLLLTYYLFIYLLLLAYLLLVAIIFTADISKPLTLSKAFSDKSPLDGKNLQV